MRLSTALLSVVLFVAFGALPLAHAQSAEFRGTVTDAQDRPVPSVNVVLERADGGDRVAGTSTKLVQWLYVVLGLAPAILSVTGTVIWYQRWRTVAPAEKVPAATEENTRFVVPPEERRSGGEETAIPPRP